MDYKEFSKKYVKSKNIEITSTNKYISISIAKWILIFGNDDGLYFEDSIVISISLPFSEYSINQKESGILLKQKSITRILIRLSSMCFPGNILNTLMVLYVTHI